MPVLELHKGTMHYEVHGAADAPWCVLLPGALTAPWLYHPLRDELAQGFRVLTMDYRGVAESRNDLWQVTPAQIAQDVRKLLDHLGIARCHVAAVSLGTFVLAELLHEQPERFDRVALIGMPVVRHVFMEVDDYASGAEPAIVAEVTQGSTQRLGPMQQVLIGVLPRKMLSRRFREERPDRFRTTMQAMLQLNPTDLWIGMQQFYGLFGHDWRRLQVYESLPADRRLFVAGETDAVTPVHDLRAHPSTGPGPTVLLRGTGHLGFFEYPEVTGPIVRHFLRHGALPAELPGGGMAEPMEGRP